MRSALAIVCALAFALALALALALAPPAHAGTPPPTPPTTAASPTPAATPVAACAYDVVTHGCRGTCGAPDVVCARSGPIDCVCAAQISPMPVAIVGVLVASVGLIAVLCCVGVAIGGSGTRRRVE